MPTYRKNNGYYYKCTSKTNGISGAIEPAWKTDSTPVPVDQGVTWTKAGNILESSEVNIENMSLYLPINLTPTKYDPASKCKVVGKTFIGFSSTNPHQEEAAIENNILKVTIKSNDSAETLTQLFTIR